MKQAANSCFWGDGYSSSIVCKTPTEAAKRIPRNGLPYSHSRLQGGGGFQRSTLKTYMFSPATPSAAQHVLKRHLLEHNMFHYLLQTYFEIIAIILDGTAFKRPNRGAPIDSKGRMYTKTGGTTSKSSPSSASIHFQYQVGSANAPTCNCMPGYCRKTQKMTQNVMKQPFRGQIRVPRIILIRIASVNTDFDICYYYC